MSMQLLDAQQATTPRHLHIRIGDYPASLAVFPDTTAVSSQLPLPFSHDLPPYTNMSVQLCHCSQTSPLPTPHLGSLPHHPTQVETPLAPTLSSLPVATRVHLGLGTLPHLGEDCAGRDE